MLDIHLMLRLSAPCCLKKLPPVLVSPVLLTLLLFTLLPRLLTLPRVVEPLTTRVMFTLPLRCESRLLRHKGTMGMPLSR